MKVEEEGRKRGRRPWREAAVVSHLNSSIISVHTADSNSPKATRWRGV